MQVPKKSFVFGPMFNKPPDRANPHGNDATGAFHPGMDAWRHLYEALGAQVVSCRFNNHAPPADRRAQILEAMQARLGGDRYDAVVYFGHGSPNEMGSAGFDAASLGMLTDALKRMAKPSAKIVLFACHCAAPGGYAYRIARNLVGWANHGMEVLGHPCEGHSFRNPMVRRFPSDRGETGLPVCPEGHFAAWRDIMVSGRARFWARMPFMTMEERAAEL